MIENTNLSSAESQMQDRGATLWRHMSTPK